MKSRPLAVAPALAVLGCCGATTSPAAPTATPPLAERPAIGVPCQLSPLPAPGAAVEPLRVFVELVTVRGDLVQALRSGPPAGSSKGTFAELLNAPGVEVPRIQHLLLKNDSPETLPWDLERPKHASGCPELERWDLTTSAHADTLLPANVTLQVKLVPAPPLGTPPEGWHVPEHRQIHTTVVVKDQQTVVLGGLATPSCTSEPKSVLLVTPYVLREEADLQRLFQCKQALAARARRD